MVWIILLAILIVSYYFIFKSKSKITQKYFSQLSLVFAALTIIPILSESFSFILKLSFFLTLCVWCAGNNSWMVRY
ncbi:hypothetical protein X953_01585 [Virgibacillus sp. SK37]|nr:hypothetical protein X953_01585 [Virgibacillus sp. SK37]